MDINLADLPITNTKDITEEFIDIMGHMNVMWYTHIFDYGTRNLFASFGFGEDYVRRTGMGSFALESHIRYLAELRQGDTAIVYSRVLDRSEKLIHFMSFMMRKRDGTLAAIVETLGGHADLSQRRVTPFPQEILDKLDPLLAAHQALSWAPPICGHIGIKKKQTASRTADID
jgi:acyl-CoA thioester hydrolase